MVKISKTPWGSADGRDVFLFRLINKKGEFAEVTNYGATLVSVHVPDQKGVLENVVLGFPVLQSYINDTCYLGSTIGRFANRIGGAAFSLKGKKFELETNDGVNSNHSGSSGFHKQVFDFWIEGDKVIFSLLSPDGEGGFPGNLQVEVHYSWNDENELRIEYFGQTDQNTLFNLTNHSYFDLSAGKGRTADHQLSIFSDQVVEAGADYIPSGTLMPVGDAQRFANTRIGDKLLHTSDGVKGLNVCYVLDPVRQKAGLPAAGLYDPHSGRRMELYTSYPGLMLYTGDFLNTADPGFDGKCYEPFDGLCLEAQFFPDSPNHATFPSAELRAGELVHHEIVFKFDTHK